jgi:Tfp pilus assembly protein PilZ
MTVVDFTSQGRVYREFVNDISESGVYIQASGFFSVGHDVKMIFSFPGSQENMKITGHIARVDNTGIGIEFKLSSVDNEELRSLLN